MAAASTHGDMRWIFDDPAVRKIRHELRDGARERRRMRLAQVAIGVGAATATFFAGVEVLGLGTVLWRITDSFFSRPWRQP